MKQYPNFYYMKELLNILTSPSSTWAWHSSDSACISYKDDQIFWEVIVPDCKVQNTNYAETVKKGIDATQTTEEVEDCEQQVVC